MGDPFSRDAYRKTAGWVRRKVKDSDKWVRRWYEVNRHVLYSYMQCPAESQQAPRIAAALDLRTTQKIAVVGEGLLAGVAHAGGRHLSR